MPQITKMLTQTKKDEHARRNNSLLSKHKICQYCHCPEVFPAWAQVSNWLSGGRQGYWPSPYWMSLHGVVYTGYSKAVMHSRAYRQFSGLYLQKVSIGCYHVLITDTPFHIPVNILIFCTTFPHVLNCVFKPFSFSFLECSSFSFHLISWRIKDCLLWKVTNIECNDVWKCLCSYPTFHLYCICWWSPQLPVWLC